jgi:large subunit ribosomal protein L1
MISESKKHKLLLKNYDFKKKYDLPSAIDLLKKTSKSNFDETIDIAINLNVDPKKTDQIVKGSIVLPKGIGKKKTILVLCNPDKQDSLKNIDVDYIGYEEYLTKIEQGWSDFDVMITEPSLMPNIVKRVGRIIGPKGLMPSISKNTVTFDIDKAVHDVKKGKVDFKVDKNGTIHAGLGKKSFTNSDLIENITDFFLYVQKLKPVQVKGFFMKSVFICSTMGKSISIDLSKVLK